MSEHAMQPPEPVIPEYNQHDSAVRKSRIVWMNKDEATKLLACRAALLDCVEALEDAQPYVETSCWTRYRDDEIAQVEAAITNARKALGGGR